MSLPATDMHCDGDTLVSRKGRELYEILLGRRRSRIALAGTINELAEEAAESADEAPAGEAQPQCSPAEGAQPAGFCKVGENILQLTPRRQSYAPEPGISLVDLLDWYQNKEVDAVRGQEKALIKMTLKAIMLNSFSLEGPAGRGKTHLLKALTSVLPEEKVYWFEFATDTALFNKSEEINRHQILMVPEYQKILKSCPQTREAIKTLTEGRVAKREKMDEGVMKQYVLLPKCVITSIADENEFKEILGRDKEDMRRFSHIKVDTSYDNTLKIREFKRQKRSVLPERMKAADKSLGERIRRHLSDCIDLKLDSPPLDPFAEFMDQHLPMTDKSIAYVDDYYSYLDGCAKFHHRERMLDYGNDRVLALDLADHFTVYQIYHAEFCQMLLKLDDMESFGERGQKALEPVDWKACFEAGIAKMRENLPDAAVDKWISRQLDCSRLAVTDVLTRGEKVLFEYEQ